jgi:hypothetical protein
LGVAILVAVHWLASPVGSTQQLIQPKSWVPKARKVTTPSESMALSQNIDALVTADLGERGIAIAARASDHVFVRRVYLDVVGRIPSHREVVEFVNSDAADKRTKLIDDLLDSEGYVCHFFHFWADLLRLKSHTAHHWVGAEYAEWIKHALRTNMPYDQFAYELLTATGHPFENGAVGYRIRDKGMLTDHVGNTMQVFLGMRVQCAECHDDPDGGWSRRQFHEVAALLSQAYAPRGRRPTSRAWLIADRLADSISGAPEKQQADRIHAVSMALHAVRDRDRPLKYPDDYQYSDANPGSPVMPATPFGDPVLVNDGQSAREVFARWAVSPENPRFARMIANRIWKQVIGVGVVEPVDDLDNGKSKNPALLEFLENAIVAVDFDLKQFLRVLLNTETYQRATVTRREANQPHRFDGYLLRRMSAEQVWDSMIALVIEDADQRRGHGSAIVNSRERNEELRSMWPFAFRNWLNEPPFLDERKRRENPRHVAPMILPIELAGDEQQFWTWDMTGASDPRWQNFPRALVRASELSSPADADHFVRVVGQSDRETIGACNRNSTLSGMLAMFNDAMHGHMWHQNAVLSRAVSNASSVTEKIDVLYLSLLTRPPSAEEMKLARRMMVGNQIDGPKMLAWALINSSEFLFIQ